MNTVADNSSAAVSQRDFSRAFSRYVDGFLARRSVLDSSLFPEKPAQMWFGYETMARAFGPLTDWLANRRDPLELGAALRRACSPVIGHAPVAALWMSHMALTGLALEHRAWPYDAEKVLEYWRRVYEGESVAFTPPGTFVAGASSFQQLLLNSGDAEALAGNLDSSSAANISSALASATNFSWLMEAESRQGTYSHGLYRVDGRTLLVREFVNLAGTLYPWIDRPAAGLPDGPVAVVLDLGDVDGDFDIYGVPRLEPQDYAERIAAVGVLTPDGWVPDPASWALELGAALRAAHMALFRTVCGWSARERFIAGARSYANMFVPLVLLAGGSEDDAEQLLSMPVERAVDESLDEHLRGGQPAIWDWASGPRDTTIFAPMLEELA